MHEGDGDILIEQSAQMDLPVGRHRLLGFGKLRKFLFPGVLLLLIGVSALDQYILELFQDDYFGLAGLLIGGGFITWNTLNVILLKRRITAGVLVVLALIGSAYVGEYLAGAIVALMMIGGEFLENLTLEKTRNAVRELIRLVPDTAMVKIGTDTEKVPTAELRVGDVLVVKPGERIPVDGRILKGRAAINEASLTGESMPLDKSEGDDVYSGTLNENGALEVAAVKVGGNTALGKIIKVVREAQDNKGDSQRLADRFAAYFTPAIIVVALLVWFLHPGLLLDARLLRVMTVLVIACPCALVLATPTAVIATVGSAARNGALIKGGAVLEKASRITAVCFDKTGTVTEGRPRVVDVVSFDESSPHDILKMAAIAEKSSEHPIAQAILEKAKSSGIKTIPDSDDFRLRFGRGVAVRYQGRSVEVANARFFDEHPQALEERSADYLASQEGMGRTALLLIKDGFPVGGIAVADAVRPEAGAVVNALKEMNIRSIIMLTGDNEKTAKAIAEEVGITEFRAGLFPEEKLSVIQELQGAGEVVAMLGDGVNDAPALALSDVGISMGVIGTDVADESSDISLMTDNLSLLPQMIRAGKRTMRVVKQNIVIFAVLVNVIGIFLSATGILTPILAAVVHNMSSAFVVGNSARLLRFRYTF